jgi:hypothetical protein
MTTIEPNRRYNNRGNHSSDFKAVLIFVLSFVFDAKPVSTLIALVSKQFLCWQGLNISHITYCGRDHISLDIWLPICLYCTMPHQTERQQAADALQRAFLVNLIAEHEEDLLDFNSDSSSSNNSTDSLSSSDNEPQLAVSEMLLETLGNLYSQ